MWHPARITTNVQVIFCDSSLCHIHAGSYQFRVGSQSKPDGGVSLSGLGICLDERSQTNPTNQID